MLNNIKNIKKGKYKFRLPNNNGEGFTIIELIVVLAVFLFVIGAAISIFLSIIKNQKEILAEQQFLNQISYAQEYMSKALRMAKTAENSDCIPTESIYSLTRQNFSSGLYQGIKFINQSDNNTCQEFFLEENILKEVKGENLPVDLSSSSLKINYARFIIDGSSSYISALNCNTDSCVQPRVTILLNVAIPNNNQSGINKICNNNSSCGSNQTCINGVCTATRTIQTTISRRNLNVQQ